MEVDFFFEKNIIKDDGKSLIEVSWARWLVRWRNEIPIAIKEER